MKEFELLNGLLVPPVGLGAQGLWEIEKKSELFAKTYEIYKYALEEGKCKLFDTSESYGLNEDALGEALRYTRKREEVLLMTKIGNISQREKRVRGALEDSLKRLGTDYIDIYLIHWPQTGTYISTWREIEKLYEEGIVKAIGVCNCNKHHLQEIEQLGRIMPMINEIEVHPLFTQDALVNYCYAKDIQVVSYSPLARMHDVLIKSKPIRMLSEKYNVSRVQLILRWHYQRGFISIPRTLNKEHLNEYYSIDTFELTDKDIALINSLNDNIRLRYNPDDCDFFAL
ncbi:Aldo/keto reductase [Pseudobutyrivibrio sp. C4]|uniref:aldo/keto reductase family protein n=1 Tax=Pseudobutyrivibrio sp. C4 TaxID=1520803 RepID=UPI0008BA1E03|nr:aldo/keto reductase [Pseudobutyrivibrio sp. C4]SET12708.1 Aldo/keto reductase [Pseudobutyrivibrio sp. C4]